MMFIFKEPIDIEVARRHFSDRDWSFVGKVDDYPNILGIDPKSNGQLITKYWHFVDRDNFVWVPGGQDPKEALERYIKNLDLVCLKATPDVPHGMKKLIARAATRYGLNLDLLNQVELKEGRGHASYNRERNSMRVVPSYFLRHGMCRVGDKFIDEFLKTFVHEFGHAVWHQLLTEEQKKRWIKIVPKFHQMPLKGEMEAYMRPRGIGLDGREVYGELFTAKDALFITEYARFNPKEDFAESFLHYLVDPDILANLDEKRFNFLSRLLEAPNYTIHKVAANIEGRIEELSNFVPVDLQYNERRKLLAIELDEELKRVLDGKGIAIDNLKTISAFGEYVKQFELPGNIAAVAWVEGFPGKTHHQAGDVNLWICGDQSDADKMIYQFRDLHRAESAVPDPSVVELDKKYLQPNEIARWITTKTGQKVPIPKGKALPFGHLMRRKVTGGIKTKRPLQTRFVLQHHESKRAPAHHDFRVKVGKTAESWAIPRGFPGKLGERKLAILQPAHTVKYMGFKGTIAEGYGKGLVSIAAEGNIELTIWTKKKKSFSIYGGPLRGHYTMVPHRGNKWLIMRTRKRNILKGQYLPRDYRMKFREEMWKNEDYALIPKVGGARALLYLGSRENRLLTKYKSRIHPGFVERTDNFPSIRDAETGKMDTVLDGEIYVSDPLTTNKAMISTPDKARKLQEKKKAVFFVYDILRLDGRDLVKLPWHSRRTLLERSVKDTASLKIMPVTLRDKAKMYDQLMMVGFPSVFMFDRDAPYDTVGVATLTSRRNIERAYGRS